MKFRATVMTTFEVEFETDDANPRNARVREVVDQDPDFMPETLAHLVVTCWGEGFVKGNRGGLAEGRSVQLLPLDNLIEVAVANVREVTS